jgi:hypothetical protein
VPGLAIPWIFGTEIIGEAVVEHQRNRGPAQIVKAISGKPACSGHNFSVLSCFQGAAV